MKSYDLLILGAGPGGCEAAVLGAQLGLSVGIVEQDELGGTCLNVGCVPTKILLGATELLDELAAYRKLRVLDGALHVDLSALQRRKDQVVSAFRKGIEKRLAAHGVAVFRGLGRITDEHTVEVEHAGAPCTVPLRFQHLILATGSSPSIPRGVKVDGTRILTSDHAISLKEAPADLAIIGGGVIGCELATYFGRLGTKVTLVEMAAQLLPGEDTQIAKSLSSAFDRKGIRVRLNAQVERLTPNGDRALCAFANGEETLYQRAIVCTGREPSAAGIGLSDIGLTDKGPLSVNERMETAIPHIYAIGDLTGKGMLAHVASRQGVVAAENAAGGDARMAYHAIPSCVFSSPEIFGVGLTKEAAQKLGLAVCAGEAPLATNAKAQASGDPAGFVKIVAEKGSGRIVGVQGIGHHVTGLAAEAALMIQQEITLAAFCETIHPHPTLSESLHEAAEKMLHHG
ncbi:MAG: dihydrolipoyl dehydrogenase [Candidatus Latescibacterota bacterium]